MCRTPFPKSAAEEAATLRVPADRGAAWAQYNLGCYYARGTGVAKSFEEATKWLTKAAEQGHAEAQYNLGCCYRDGEGVAQSFAEATKWLTKAAEQGHAMAGSRALALLCPGSGLLLEHAQGIVQRHPVPAHEGFGVSI